MNILWQNKKTVKKNEQKLVKTETKNFEVNIKTYANWLDDEEMLRKISSIDLIPKEIRYHGFCRTEYQTRTRKTPYRNEPKRTPENKLAQRERKERGERVFISF